VIKVEAVVFRDRVETVMDAAQRGGTHGSPTNPLLLLVPSRSGLRGSRRAKPGSAGDRRGTEGLSKTQRRVEVTR
jgi:hypothetical protein